MKTIGLVGGMSFESTLTYYKIINEYVNKALGGVHSAKILLYSMEFQEISDYQEKEQWNDEQILLIEACKTLENAGADFLAMCCNTTHKFAESIEDSTKIPLLHIADATAAEITEKGVRKVGLLGTRFTMEEPFYKERLTNFGIEAIVPEKDDITIVNDIIFGDLCKASSDSINGVSVDGSGGDSGGHVIPSYINTSGMSEDFLLENSQRAKMKRQLIDIICKLKEQGATGIVLGCTELGLILNQGDMDIAFGKDNLQIFDTAIIHAESIAKFAIMS